MVRKTSSNRAYSVANKKREKEEERHRRRLEKIDKEYWDRFYRRK